MSNHSKAPVIVPIPHVPCRSDRRCTKPECTFAHTVDKCKDWNNCRTFACVFRHDRSRIGPCREGSECNKAGKPCAFLHPVVQSQTSRQPPLSPQPSQALQPPLSFRPKQCSYNKACVKFDCKFLHSEEKCRFWEDCASFICNLRHGPIRLKPCRQEGRCFDEACKFLHPSECVDADCLRGLCRKRHPVSPLLRIRAKEDLKKTFIHVHVTRKKHVEKMSSVVSKVRTLQGVPQDEELEAAEQRRLVLSTLRQQGLELQTQLDFFDSCIAEEYQRLVSTSPLLSDKYKKAFFFRCRRECLRLTLALPALSMRQHVLTSLESSQFVVVKGETGSGKSTQLPQYVLETLSNNDSQRYRVICTQPRKVSAVSLAERVAQEWSGDLSRPQEVGGVVGYRVGGASSKISRLTRLEYTTEGTFLQTLMRSLKGEKECSDPLRSVAAIIIDEAHERSTLCDILLGLLQTEAPRRWPDIKIIVTSATLDTELFVRYFHSCPLVSIPGRMFPVDIVYRPLAGSTGPLGVDPKTSAVVQASVDQALWIIQRGGEGDVLSFLTGQEEVERAKDMLERQLNVHRISTAKAFVLYGKQPPEEQQLVFKSFPGQRKVIFATDVAETGLTIDGVRHVIDSGLSKEARFDPRRNVTVLQVDSICKSSAKQRCGRAGRTAPGTCYRLYSEEDWHRMDLSPQPEVLSKPLDLTVVTLLSMGITRPDQFRWMQPPNDSSLHAALSSLLLLQAITHNEDGSFSLTDLGKIIADLQIDPSLARIIYRGCQTGLGLAACTLAGVLSVASTFFWRGGSNESKLLADEQHAQFSAPEGDVISMMCAFKEWVSLLENSKSDESPIKTTEEQKDDEGISLASDDDRSVAEDEDDLGLVTLLNPAFTNLFAAFEKESSDGDDDEFENNSVNAGNQTFTGEFLIDSLVMEFEDESDLGSVSEMTVDELNQEATREAEAKMRAITRLASSKVSRQWCKERCLNSKSLLMALSARDDFLRTIKKFQAGAFWSACRQDIEPTVEQWQRLVCEGFFSNLSWQLKQGSCYCVLRHDEPQIAMIHPGSSLFKLHKKDPKSLPGMVVFFSLLTTSRTFMTCLTSVDISWVKEISPEFHARIEAKMKVMRNDRVVVSGVPPNLGWKIIGKGGRDKWLFEEALHCSLSYDEKAMSLEAWVSEENKSVVVEALETLISERRSAALQQREEVVISGNTRAVIKAGYIVDCLLFDNEFIAINVLNLPGSVRRSDFLAFLKMTLSPGALVCLDWTDGDDRRPAFVSVKFSTAAHAAAALTALRGELFNGSLLIVVPSDLKPQPQPAAMSGKATLSWPFAASEGKAYLYFSSSAAALTFLSSYPQFVPSLAKSLHLPSSALTIHLPKGGEKPSLVISNLPATVDEIGLQQYISAFLVNVQAGLDLYPSRIMIRRSPAQVEEAEGFLAVQLADLNALLPLGDNITERTSFFETKTGGRAGLVVQYDSLEALEDAQQVWKSCCQKQSFWDSVEERPPEFSFGADVCDNTTPLLLWKGQPVRFTVQFTASVMAHQSLWQGLEKPLSSLLTDLQKGSTSLKVTTQPLKVGAPVPRVVLLFKSPLLAVVRSAQRSIQALFEPDILALPKEEMRAFVFTPAGSRQLQQLSNALAPKSVFLHWDRRRQQVYAYGPTNQAKREAAQEVISRIEEVLRSCEKRSFTVRDKKGLISAWKATKFGRDALHMAYVGPVRRCEVTVTANKATLDEIEAWLKQSGLLLADSKVAPGQPLSCEGCFVCGSPQEEVDQPYFYAACAHGGCHGCVSHQFTSVERGDFNLPMICMGCFDKNATLALSDITSLASSKALSALAERAVDDYIGTHKESLMYCPKPGCNAILLLAKQLVAVSEKAQEVAGGHEIIFCHGCNDSYCVCCCQALGKVVPVHIGMSCEDFRIGNDSEVQGYVRAICEDILSFHCPHCKRLVFDYDSCSAVTCTCGRDFCGICFSAHPNSGACHQHVKNCSRNPNPNSYYVSQNQLQVVYKQQRVESLKRMVSPMRESLRYKVLKAAEQYLRDVNITIAELK
ncbi:DEAD/DEAH box helicase [archaeon]|nr:MAG: DEAD/DEAH box helicase [archaeon]